MKKRINIELTYNDVPGSGPQAVVDVPEGLTAKMIEHIPRKLAQQAEHLLYEMCAFATHSSSLEEFLCGYSEAALAAVLEADAEGMPEDGRVLLVPRPAGGDGFSDMTYRFLGMPVRFKDASAPAVRVENDRYYKVDEPTWLPRTTGLSL